MGRTAVPGRPVERRPSQSRAKPVLDLPGLRVGHAIEDGPVLVGEPIIGSLVAGRP